MHAQSASSASSDECSHPRSRMSSASSTSTVPDWQSSSERPPPIPPAPHFTVSALPTSPSFPRSGPQSHPASIVVEQALKGTHAGRSQTSYHDRSPPERSNLHVQPICVRSRAGVLRSSEKVEWQMIARPAADLRLGTHVCLYDRRGTYLGITRTITGIVGLDKHWVKFLLRRQTIGNTAVQTLSVPLANAFLPLLYAIIHAIVYPFLPDEHPNISLPLPLYANLATISPTAKSPYSLAPRKAPSRRESHSVNGHDRFKAKLEVE